MTLDTIARTASLGFLPVQEERYDFAVPKSRVKRPGVVAFTKLLAAPVTREALARLGMKVAAAGLVGEICGPTWHANLLRPAFRACASTFQTSTSTSTPYPRRCG